MSWDFVLTLILGTIAGIAIAIAVSGKDEE